MPPLPFLHPLLAFFALLLLLPTFPAAGPVQEALHIPPGTILPVSIKHTFSSNDSARDHAIEARVMQDVPLPNNDKIPAGATLYGSVVSATPSSGDSGGKVTLRFDKLEFHHKNISVLTALRAMAPMVDVLAAQYPVTPGEEGTPSAWATTVQIGGDIRYGVGGAVKNRKKETVGKGVPNGVLVHISSQPGSPCQGDADPGDRLQALWVFSADSCGIYDLKGLTIANTGSSEPLGDITLAKDKGELKIENSTGLLLRVLH
jgi:hypothetical protein